VRYAVLCMADNWANGVNSDFELSLTAFRDLVKKNEHTVQTLVESILKEAVKLAKT
jgi:purine nucleoside phosphorylase